MTVVVPEQTARFDPEVAESTGLGGRTNDIGFWPVDHRTSHALVAAQSAIQRPNTMGLSSF